MSELTGCPCPIHEIPQRGCTTCGLSRSSDVGFAWYYCEANWLLETLKERDALKEQLKLADELVDVINAVKKQGGLPRQVADWLDEKIAAYQHSRGKK